MALEVGGALVNDERSKSQLIFFACRRYALNGTREWYHKLKETSCNLILSEDSDINSPH